MLLFYSTHFEGNLTGFFKSENLTSLIEQACQNRQALLYMPIILRVRSTDVFREEKKKVLIIIVNSKE